MPALPLLLVLAVPACSGTPGPEGPAPEPPPAERPDLEPQRPTPEPPSRVTPIRGEAGDPLRPSEASLRTAERADLTGTELGTMWTFENPPLDYWEETYGFRPDEAWLEHVRLSSVRYGSICSASFVSPNGLVMTNHHCARDCVEAVSTPDSDYVDMGFHAPRRAAEKVCPDLYLDQLVEIEEVTARIQGAAPEGAAADEVTDAQAAEAEAIEEECEASTDFECQVVSLFHGGQHQLYKYRRFQPVKLVFAPELQAGFYGGDPDNFTYPRYTLDISFVRAYAGDGETPASTPHHFAWDEDGAAEGELVFITGNPGSTNRQATVAELMYEQRFNHPFTVQILEKQVAFLRSIAERGPQAERAVRDQLFSLENSLKAFSGQLEGLNDTLLVGRKIRWEREFQRRIRRDAEHRRRYGTVWDSIATIQRSKLATAPRINLANPDFFGIPQLSIAGGLVRRIREMALPEAERAEDFRDPERLEQLEEQLLSPQVPPAMAVLPLMVARMELADAWIGADDPLRAAFFQPGETPAAAARRLLTASRIGELAVRQGLFDGGPDVLASTDDPLLRLAVVLDSVSRALQPRWRELQAAQTVQEERLAKALFAAFGTDLPPDATFTLRISDGEVRRYPYNGTVAAPFTTFYGLYGRSLAFGNEMPWRLPDAFAERREAVDPATRLNFVTTNDITGGNSGSPMIDRDGRVVGIAFDGNIEQLPNEFLFRTDAGRTVGVHSAGILEALRAVYQADELVEEITGGGR